MAPLGCPSHGFLERRLPRNGERIQELKVQARGLGRLQTPPQPCLPSPVKAVSTARFWVIPSGAWGTLWSWGVNSGSHIQTGHSSALSHLRAPLFTVSPHRAWLPCPSISRPTATLRPREGARDGAGRRQWRLLLCQRLSGVFFLLSGLDLCLRKSLLPSCSQLPLKETSAPPPTPPTAPQDCRLSWPGRHSL